MAQVRYIVDDVADAVGFYVSKLGFELEQQYGPAKANLVHGDLRLWLAGPKASASRPMPDGASRLRKNVGQTRDSEISGGFPS